MTQRPENTFAAYHAHVYFGPDTVSQARALCEAAGRHFAGLGGPGLGIGRVHEREVGPHPRWSCQLSFDSAAFQQVIAWLEANRGGLDILVHGLTGDDLADHTDHASWLGNEATLKLEMFRRG
ncbi:MAG: 4,5-dioxygenase [Comamonadaceae bacterium]|nr:MAG: 4,5-dioxygenase [Comamonadaceae bacterium]